MSIRTRIILIVLPLIIGPLVVTGYVTSLTARNGITRAVTGLLTFKQEELLSYARSQWSLLTENNLAGEERFVNASRAAVESFARSIIRTPTELIFAVGSEGDVRMSTAPLTLSRSEKNAIRQIISGGSLGWMTIQADGITRVSQVARFEPFGWYVFVTDQRSAFYSVVNAMYAQTGIILGASLAAAVVLLILFSHLLIRPLRGLTSAMRQIISTGDLTRRVDVLLNDETGELGHTFNLMTEQLHKSSNLVKSFALQAVVSQHKEQKIRNIFQRYVPRDVIEQFFSHPESMLKGDDRILSVLFSDIRGFTTLSEIMKPDEIVESLNAYFSAMVDVIVARRGIVDKYMGDAIMAFFGAPVRHGDEAEQAVRSAFEMLAALRDFNSWQTGHGRPEFRMGIGINYGVVTVGNIGHAEKKMDYTVIGDMVNLASRLEGLSKYYRQTIVFSESVARKVESLYPCRLLERVVVKGKTQAIGLYTARERLTTAEEKAWRLYNEALRLFYERAFSDAARRFQAVQRLLPDDEPSLLFVKQCHQYLRTPPPKDAQLARVMTEK